MLERVKFTNMNRSQSQSEDDYMSQLKYTTQGCVLTNSKERIRDQFIKCINNQKYQEECLQVASDNIPLGELGKVAYKLEAVMLSTNALQNLSTQVDTVNKNIANQSQCGRDPNCGGTHGRG